MKLIVSNGPFTGEVELPISKSIANRYQIIAALAKLDLKLPNSLPEDVKVLRDVLSSNSAEINIGMAGTAMRFLTAYYSTQEGKTVELTGDERMKQRPISELVTVLRELGAEIEYSEKYGFPPLKIVGKKLKGGKVEISASVSSQYVSALMMIGPMMQNGLEIQLKGKVLSRPYIDLTVSSMQNCGVEVGFDGRTISIPSGKYSISKIELEADWSAASYFYALAAAKPNSKLLLKGLHLNSAQGDSVLVDWFEKMSVSSTQKENGVEVRSSDKIDFPSELDFTNHPDLAQTFAFVAATLGKELKLTGLDNLRLKETDRVAALKTELQKLGVTVTVEGNAMTVSGSISAETACIKTYNDHRMAMSASILSAIIPTEVENEDVVAKSFPLFWDELYKFAT